MPSNFQSNRPIFGTSFVAGYISDLAGLELGWHGERGGPHEMLEQ